MPARGYEFYFRVFNSSERSKRVRYGVEQEKIKFVSISVFDDFPKISDHFPKIFQNCSKGQTNVSEHFRRLPKTTEENPKMFRSYIDKFKCS